MKYIVFSLLLCLILESCKTKKQDLAQNFNAPDSIPVGLRVGQKAPDLELKTPYDSIIKLSSLKGYYVLVDFWASWCGPCRRENPAVVQSFEKYKDAKFNFGKGYRIFSVSLDNNKDSWKNAIEKDRLIWPFHVSDLKGWSSEASAKYMVNSIPANWLIDPRGIIIAKGLRGISLMQELEKNIQLTSTN